MTRTVFWVHRGVDKSGIGGHSLVVRIAGIRRGTVVGDYGTELLVVLGEGGGDGVYLHGDNFVFVVICGGYAWEIECGDCITD